MIFNSRFDGEREIMKISKGVWGDYREGTITLENGHHSGVGELVRGVLGVGFKGFA